MKNYLAMSDEELDKSELFPYRCSFPTCTRQVGFAARRCPEHWTPELAQSNIHVRRFVQADPEEIRADDRRDYPWV